MKLMSYFLRIMPSEAIIVRRLARELSLRRRFERLTVRDQVRGEKMKKLCSKFKRVVLKKRQKKYTP